MQTSRLATIALGLFVLAAAPVGRAIAVDYLTEIKPILAEKCYSCHGRIKQESGLRLETRLLMIDGDVIQPGNPDSSLLLDRILATDDSRMPPPEDGSALKVAEVELIRNWIRDGAAAPDEEVPSGPTEHWAFQEISPPTISNLDSSTNPIDALLSVKRSAKAIETTPPARRSILLRRLYLDLIGLPPTVEQLNDDRPWEIVVDELLQSPQHGERWARHWMDVWRYSDWHGLGEQLRYSQKHLWHWRDWIVQSINADKGYDRMIHEMLAGDELDPNNPDVVRATGFLARNYYLFNRTTWLDSTIEHTSKAFFGLTVNCAKCHDHKYDPVTHLDYYKMRAIFEPHQVRLDPIPGVTDFEQDGLPRVFDDHTELATHLHLRGDPKSPDTETTINAGVPSFLASFQPAIRPVELPVEAYSPGTRTYVQEDQLALITKDLVAAERAFNTAKEGHAKSLLENVTPPSHDNEEFVFNEDFDRPDSEAWKLIGDSWQYKNGALCQKRPSRDREFARLLRKVPRDFDLSCEYTTTGGAIYKSVTFRFDQSEDNQRSNSVYTSAHAPGPKVQIAFTRDGKTTYPPEGRKGSNISVGTKYKLRFAVRDTLVNVWLDDSFLVAYRLPDRHHAGFLSLSGFDATVEFDQLTIRSLGDDVVLQDANKNSAPSKSDAERALKLSESKLAVAVARLESLQATIAAQNARYRGETTTAELLLLDRIAATKQAKRQFAQADYLGMNDPSKAKQAKQMRDKATKRIAAIENGDVAYEPIRAAQKALETPAHKETEYPSTYSQVSTGRRLALARWATSPRNPLTARVAVNHIWMRHFGKPLVDSVFDFGLRAPKPVQAELLDYLAYELMRSGWSMRHLHRMIALSDAYQLSCEAVDREHEMQADATNDFYWRANTRRMESQVVRDSLLHLAGVLDTTVGGPSVSANQDSLRRSLYFKHSTDDRDRFLSMFDDADALQCYRRSESVVPQQALALANSKLAITVSAQIADRISVKHNDQTSFIGAVFRLLLAREATNDELEQCELFFVQMDDLKKEDAKGESDKQARARFVQAIINHNDFVSIR